MSSCVLVCGAVFVLSLCVSSGVFARYCVSYCARCFNALLVLFLSVLRLRCGVSALRCDVA